MNTRRLFFVLIILALLAATWGPVPARAAAPQAVDTQVKLQVNNKTGQAITLKLTGAATYTKTVQPGKSEILIVKGKYTYSYTPPCGTKQSGKLEATGAKVKLVMPACKTTAAKGAKTIVVVIRNNTNGYMTLVLTGPASYRFSLAPGVTKINVLQGKYQYTAYGCGGASASGTKNLRGKNEWTWFCY